MRSFVHAALVLVAALAFSCSKDHQNLPTAFSLESPATPTNLVVTGGVERSTVSWHYPPSALGAVREFRVYQYVPSYDILDLVGTTGDTVFVDSLLVGNISYCYKVAAVDTTGLEGWRTASVCAFVRTGSAAVPAR
jgi:hypothetical protein